MSRTPAIGDSLRYEGHTYTLTGFDLRGVFRFDRPAGQEPGDTPKRMGYGVTADLTWADDLSAWYLPLRVAPRLSGVLTALHAAGATEDQVNDVRRAVQAHPAYSAGRDDQALAAVLPSQSER